MEEKEKEWGWEGKEHKVRRSINKTGEEWEAWGFSLLLNWAEGLCYGLGLTYQPT